MYDHESENPPEEAAPKETVDRRTVLERAAGISAAGSLLGGATGVASAHEKPHELVLKALTEKTRVRIEVSGEIAKGEHAGDDDTIENGNAAISRIDTKGEVDSFRFSGDIVRFVIVEGDVRVAINGEERNPDALGRSSSPPLPNEIFLDALSDGVEVRIVVSEKIVKGNLSGGSDAIKNHNVAISRSHKKAEVDNFHYSGEIVEFEVLQGDVRVYVNGEKVDPGALGKPKRKPSLPNEVVLTARSDRVRARIEVSGDIAKGAQAEDDDTINGDNAAISRMNTEGEADSFRYSGVVERVVVVEGSVDVRFNRGDP